MAFAQATFSALLSFATASFVYAQTAQLKVIKIEGSSALSNFAKALTPQALKQGIGLAVTAEGTAAGLKCAAEKTCQIGMVNEVTDKDKEKLAAVFLGSNAKGIVVSKDVTVTNLSNEQVKAIFTGQIKNWKEVGGQDLPINVWHRSKKVGIRDSFDQFFDLEIDTSKGIEVGSMPELMNRIKFNKNATGVISYNSVRGAQNLSEGFLKVVSLDGVEPTTENVRSGKYKFTSPYHLVMHKDFEKDPAVSTFVKIVLEERKNHFPKMDIEY